MVISLSLSIESMKMKKMWLLIFAVSLGAMCGAWGAAPLDDEPAIYASGGGDLTLSLPLEANAFLITRTNATGSVTTTHSQLATQFEIDQLAASFTTQLSSAVGALTESFDARLSTMAGQLAQETQRAVVAEFNLNSSLALLFVLHSQLSTESSLAVAGISADLAQEVQRAVGVDISLGFNISAATNSGWCCCVCHFVWGGWTLQHVFCL